MRSQTLREEIISRRDEIAAPSADRMQWNDALRAILPDYRLENWTDFNYSKCHTYELLLPREIRSSPGSLEEEQQLIQSLGGSRASLLLKLSAIAPYYLLCVVVRTINPQDGSVHERYTLSRSTEERGLWEQLVSFAEQSGFSPIDPESLSMLIPEIEMELAEPGTVTAYNCLFEDQANTGVLPYPSIAAGGTEPNPS